MSDTYCGRCNGYVTPENRVRTAFGLRCAPCVEEVHKNVARWSEFGRRDFAKNPPPPAREDGAA